MEDRAKETLRVRSLHHLNLVHDCSIIEMPTSLNLSPELNEAPSKNYRIGAVQGNTSPLERMGRPRSLLAGTLFTEPFNRNASSRLANGLQRHFYPHTSPQSPHFLFVALYLPRPVDRWGCSSRDKRQAELPCMLPGPLP